MALDLVIRGGTVATAEKTFRADVGLAGERIAELGARRNAKRVIAASGKHGALVMGHAENHGMISWLAGRMVKQGNTLPRYHAICHTRGSEAEAIQRVTALAELVDCPILIVHVSTIDGIEAIRQARARGLKVFGETCPQYLFLTAKEDRKSTRLNSSHQIISYAVFCLKKKKYSSNTRLIGPSNYPS